MTSQTTATITATGNLEHLGLTTFAGLASASQDSASCKGGITVTEHDAFTAANGDKLFISTKDPHSVQLPRPPTRLLVLGLSRGASHRMALARVDYVLAETEGWSRFLTTTYQSLPRYYVKPFLRYIDFGSG